MEIYQFNESMLPSTQQFLDGIENVEPLSKIAKQAEIVPEILFWDMVPHNPSDERLPDFMKTVFVIMQAGEEVKDAIIKRVLLERLIYLQIENEMLREKLEKGI